MNRKNYITLLEQLEKTGYSFKFFDTFDTNLNNQIILRHDIDFDLHLAEEMATLENEMGICSTYYFLLSSDSYNIFSQTNKNIIHTIKKMGHDISLHFDPTVYLDEPAGFSLEKEIFEKEFGAVTSVAFHRPSASILNGVNWLPKGIRNTYDPTFFKETTYISDSGGEFRFGHPLDSEAFQSLSNIQLLIHPIWWLTNSNKTVEKLEFFLEKSNKRMSKHMSDNCKPWRSHLDEE